MQMRGPRRVIDSLSFSVPLPKRYRRHIMFRNVNTQPIIALIFLTSLLLNAVPTAAQDLVATNDLSAGTSVFVFRGSSKRPQERMGGGSLSASRSGYMRTNINKQTAFSRQRRAEQVRAQQAVAAKAKAGTAKVKLSNTLAVRAGKVLEAGDLSGAITNFRETLKVNPKNAAASAGLSQALTAKAMETAGGEDNAEAREYLQEAVKLDAKNDAAFAKLGEMDAAAGRDAEAVVNYQKALAIDPQFTSLYLPLAMAYVETGELEKAGTYIDKAEALGGDSVADARLARAKIFYKQNRNDEALAVIEKAVQDDPRNAAAYTQQGAVYSRMEKRSMAFASYKKAVDVDPEYAPAYFDLGVLYYNGEDFNNALVAYRNVVRIEPQNYKAHANLASTYRQLERFPEANAQYKLAEPGNRQNAELYSEWGFCLGKTLEWDKAAERLEKAKSLNPDAIDQANVGWAYYNQAEDLKKQDRDEEAEAIFAKSKEASQKAVEIDPKLDAAYLNLGSANNSTGDYQAAKTALDEALNLRKDWVPAMNQLGLSYRGMNDLAGAVDQFNRVLRVDGNNVMGLFGLGSAESARGNKKEAKRAQDRLRKVDPKLADELGNVIAGRLIDEGKRQLIRKLPRIPGLPF